MQEGKRGGEKAQLSISDIAVTLHTSLRNRLQPLCSWTDKQFADLQKKPASRCSPFHMDQP